MAAQVEAACIAFYGQGQQQAQDILLAFQASNSALPDAFHLLWHSSVSWAQFHAALTLRTVAMRNWSIWNAQERQSWFEKMNALLENVRVFEMENFVVAQLYRTYAVGWKRQWMDVQDPMRTILQQVQKLEEMGKKQGTGMKIMAALLAEFAAGTASPLMMPIEFHARVADTVQGNGLHDVMAWTLQTLQTLMHSFSNSVTVDASGRPCVNDEIIERLSTTLEVAVEVTCWHFHLESGNGATTWNAPSTSQNAFHPGKEWRSLLVQPSWMTTLFSFYRDIRQMGLPTLARKVRHLLIQYASLSGEVFSNDVEKIHFMSHVFQGCLSVLSEPLLDTMTNVYSSREAAEHEILDMCQLILRLVTNLTSFGKLEGLLTSSILQPLVQHLSSLCCKLLLSATTEISARSTVTGFSIDDVWQITAFEDLLDAWMVILTDPLADQMLKSQSVQIEAATYASFIHMLQEYSAPVFEHYIQLQLVIASMEALEEEEETDEVDTAVSFHEQLVSLGTLGRVNASRTLQQLHQAVGERLERLKMVDVNATSLSPDAAQLFEQMHFLVRLTGIVLADDYEGETPQIPAEIHQTSRAASTLANDPVVQMIQLLFSIFDVEGYRFRTASSPQNDTLSPYLAEQLLETLTRVVVVYLAPSEEVNGPVSPHLIHEFDVGVDKAGNRVLEFIVQRCSEYLALWSGEPAVMKKVCHLLVMMSKSRMSATTITMPVWHSLLQANANAGSFLTNSTGLSRLPSDLRGTLTQAIVRTGMSAPTDEMRKAHFHEIVTPIANVLSSIVNVENFGSLPFVNNIEIIETIKLVLELYSGIIAASEANTFAMITTFILPALPVFVKLLDVFHGHNQIVYLILKIFSSLVESQIAYLPPREALQIYTACAELLRTYSKHNLGLKSRNAASSEEESHMDVLQILDLLSFLIAKDCIDFSDDTASIAEVDGAEVAVSDVVFYGLGIVIPLMTESLLQFPKLCLHFFNLVSYVIENFAEKLTTIEPSLFTMLMNTLHFGIKHLRKDIAQYSLRAISELASFHYKAIRRGEIGISAHLDNNIGLFTHFLKTIFHDVLLELYRAELMESYANAVLPLILCCRDQYLSIAHEFAAGQPHGPSQQRVVDTFGQLMTGKDPNTEMGLDRFCRRHFRRNWKHFVTETRGMIQIK